LYPDEVRWWALVALGSLGCNRIFDIGNTGLEPALDGSIAPDADPSVDLDRDGTRDIEDSCIAPDTDLLVDSDGDGLPNAGDPCPFDLTAATDADGDGIGDRCDPFPQMAGDRRRCLMAFTAPDLDVQMWKPRDDPPVWNVSMPRYLSARLSGSVRADWSFEAPSPGTTTYQAWINEFTPYHQVSLLARSSTAPDGKDVGCLVMPGDVFGVPAAIGGGWMLQTTGGASALSTTIPSGTTARMLLTATFSPVPSATGINLRCTVRFESGVVLTVDDTLPLPVGTLALSTTAISSVFGLSIYERDDAPL
jgi:hypothetical protein